MRLIHFHWFPLIRCLGYILSMRLFAYKLSPCVYVTYACMCACAPHAYAYVCNHAHTRTHIVQPDHATVCVSVSASVWLCTVCGRLLPFSMWSLAHAHCQTAHAHRHKTDRFVFRRIFRDIFRDPRFISRVHIFRAFVISSKLYRLVTVIAYWSMGTWSMP